MKLIRCLRLILPALLCVSGPRAVLAQFVNVTLKLDGGQISVGEMTTLRVFAQVVPGQRATSDRIFAWYVDLLNEGATVAKADYTKLQKPTSDKDPRTSSAGTTDGAHRRGIYDTFLNRAGAGVTEPVELFNVPLIGLNAGRARFRVQAGTGVSGLAADFIVAPKGGGDPLIGGSYASAQANLEVIRETVVCTPKIVLAHDLLPGGNRKVTLTFPTCSGTDLFAEFSDTLKPGSWQTLPGAPHNSGTATEITAARARFYRVRVQAGSGACVPRLTLTRQPAAGGQHTITLNFTPCAGRTHVVEFRDSLGAGSWQPLPGAPHDSGTAAETTAARARFYRVRVQ
ncbi:MAG: hypothetical protein HYY24_13600 [Verrucomicrobia bacterium]|nr:hypothetical protein [Verrucomicrobiota bacterium]